MQCNYCTHTHHHDTLILTRTRTDTHHSVVSLQWIQINQLTGQSLIRLQEMIHPPVSYCFGRPWSIEPSFFLPFMDSKV
ncbi:hypothetical protein BofuT4_uP131320.1 [Botrytis cinerea T4]|uniref:Uncharacterized protein n=1 Tax=Botryotinia fuckeliana (strain T4) TaxID=999810 RepID=G2YQQ4_BOTF4|nr:hypothetical protein BofuT4_uP131320.1 [Botrytis cinerea T4]